MKKKSKNKLPKYWIGTRMPTSIGYQRNQGGGLSKSSLTPGEDITPDVKTIRQNTAPMAISKFMQSSSPALQSLQRMYGPTTTAATNAAINSALANAGSGLSSSGALGVSEVSNTINNLKNIGQSGAGAASSGASGSSGALGVAGNVASILGAAYGTYDWIDQLVNRKNSVRSAQDMLKTTPTLTVTTPGGHTYTERGGVNLGAELGYNNANKTSKDLNFLATTVGAGLSAGSLGGPVGMGVGAGVGALLGGAGALLGWFDNEDETRRNAAAVGESNIGFSRQNRSKALSLDLRDAVGAAHGKLPHVTSKSNADSMGSNGEWVGKIDPKTGDVVSAFQIPGMPNTEDKVPLKNVANDPRSFVITNLGGLSDYVTRTGDFKGALETQELYQDMGILKKFGQKKAKCGKMPKYALGTVGEYVASLLPHAVQLAAAGQQYRRDYNAPTYVPKMEADYSGAISSAYRMMGDQIDKRPYLNQSNDAFRQAAWDLRRNPGYGYGGRMIGYDSLFRSKLAQDAQTSLNIDLQDQAQRNKAEAALQTILGHSTAINNQNMGAWIAMTQQANAAKENALRQDLYNLTVPIAGAASDYLKVANTNAARAYKERVANMYDRQLTLDELRTLRDWQDRDSKDTKNDVSSVYNQYKLSTPDLLSQYRSYADRLSDKFGRQFTLTPPIQYYMNPGYSYRNIPNLTYIYR